MKEEFNEKLIAEITSILRTDELTSRALDDNCTDGYDTHYVLLANKIIEIIKQKIRNKEQK